jgi:hypothetical protein
MCLGIAKVESPEVPPLVTTGFTAMLVKVERVTSKHASSKRKRDDTKRPAE